MGEKFAAKITSRFDQSSELPTLLEFVRGGDGKSVYDAFLANATQKWPGYVSELKGVSAGSGQPFDAVFTMNMRQEIGYFVPALAGHTWIGHCSDVVVVVAGNGGEGGGDGSSVLIDAHNEDSSGNDRNNTFLLHVKVSEKQAAAAAAAEEEKGKEEEEEGATPLQEFYAYVYAGDLPSGAFGWAPAPRSLAFSLNYVAPAEAVLGGYGRGFLSRALLDAASLDEMEAVATMPGQCAGHNYQLMDFDAQRILNVEAANHDQAAVYEVVAAAAGKGEGSSPDESSSPDASPDASPFSSPFFHANEYLHLSLNQTYSASSQAREARFAELDPPADAPAALAVLGDSQPTHPPTPPTATADGGEDDGDDVYTIYGDGLHDGYTLHSALFDLKARTVAVMAGNPQEDDAEIFRFDV